MPKDNKELHPVPDTLPKFITDVSRPILAEREKAGLTPLGFHKPAEKIDLTKRKPYNKSQLLDTNGIILTLPSINMTDKVHEKLEFLHVYKCTTKSILSANGNYQMAVYGIGRDGEHLEIDKIGIPADAVVFSGHKVNDNIISKIMEIISQAEAVYRKRIEFFIEGYTSRYAEPGKVALYFPKTNRDICGDGAYVFAIGRGHLVTLTDAQDNGKQEFKVDDLPRERFKAPITAMIYELPLNIRQQIKDLNAVADQNLREKVTAYLMSDTEVNVEVAPPAKGRGGSCADSAGPAVPAGPMSKKVRPKARGTPGDLRGELIEVHGLGLGVRLVAFRVGMFVVPDLLGGFALGEEQEVGLNAGVGGEDPFRKADDGMQVAS